MSKKEIKLDDLIQNQFEVHGVSLEEIIKTIAFQLGGLIEAIRVDNSRNDMIDLVIENLNDGAESYEQFKTKGESKCH